MQIWDMEMMTYEVKIQKGGVHGEYTMIVMIK